MLLEAWVVIQRQVGVSQEREQVFHGWDDIKHPAVDYHQFVTPSEGTDSTRACEIEGIYIRHKSFIYINVMQFPCLRTLEIAGP